LSRTSTTFPLLQGGNKKLDFSFLAKNHSPLEEGEEYEGRVFRGIEPTLNKKLPIPYGTGSLKTI
jgi:hypothetical protein